MASIVQDRGFMEYWNPIDLGYCPEETEWVLEPSEIWILD